MRISRIAVSAATLAVAILLAGCASCAGLGDEAPSPISLDEAANKSVMTDDELHDLARQPFDEQRRRFDVVLASHPEDLAARFLRTQADFKLEDDQAMIADSALVLAHASLNPRWRRVALVWRAEALVHAGRAAEAVPVANEAVGIDSSDAKALFARGWARYKSDPAQPESALADLDAALHLEPEEGVGYYRRACILKSQGRFERAVDDFERAVRLAPDDAPSHLEFGVTLLQIKDIDRARQQFDATARLMPHDPTVWIWRGQADLAARNFDEVMADANRSIELGATEEDLAGAHTLLALALQDKMDFAGAAREYQRSLAIMANESLTGNLARMLWFSGQFEQAIDPLRERAASPHASPYVPLWLFIVRGRANPADESAAKGELAALAPPRQPHEWKDTLVDLMLGKSTLEVALAEADAAPTYQLKAGQRCEADYYAAEQLLVHGHDERASRLLEEAYWVCPSTYIEADAVIAERRLLAARLPAR